MPVGDYCTEDCCTARPDESVLEAAKRMDSLDVGSLVVIDGDGRPRGIVTDRDIALRVVRRGLPAASTPLSDIVEPDLVALREETPLMTACRRLRAEGLRRLPVVDSDGKLVGVFSVDDGVKLIAQQMAGISEVATEQTTSALPAAGS
jgi:CBS domain-containing protein